MLTILSEPSPIVPVLNEAEWTIESDNYITTAGVAYATVFVNSINPTDGLTLIVSFGSYSEIFTFRNSPATDFDIQIPPSPSGFNTALRANMKAAFEKHYLIVAAYHICTIPAGVFSIQARETGSANNITFTGTAISGGNLTALIGYPIAGVTEVRREGFALHVDVFSETSYGSNVYNKIVQERYSFDNASNTVADVAPVLVSIVDYKLPNFNQTTPSTVTPPLRKFYLGLGEYYNNDVNNYRIGDVKRALLAGLPEAQIPVSTFYADHFTAATNQRFLTTQPRGAVKSNKAAQHYLYYFQRPDYTPVYVTVYMDYTDGTSSVEEQLFNLAQPEDLIILPAGYTQLDIDTIKSVGKTVKRWGVQVGANGLNHTDYTDYSEIFWYSLDEKPYQQNRYLLLANQYGGFDTLWCNGVAEYGNTVQNEQYSVFKTPDTATIIKATQKQTFGKRQTPIKISTGFVSRAYLEYAAALLLFSTQAYEIINGQYRAVIVDRDSIKETHTDADGKFQLNFTYTYAQEDNA